MDRSILMYDLFKDAPALICQLEGPDFVYRYANKEYLALMGNRPIVGLPLREAVPNLDVRLFDILHKVFTTGETFSARNFPIYASWGGTELRVQRIFSLHYEAVFDSNGKVTAIWVMALDTTEKKDLEVRLHAAEYLASLGTLAAGVGHEINNPLNYVMLNMELLRLETRAMVNATKSDAVARIEKKFDKVNDGLKAIQNVVRDLRVFSRVDGMEELTPTNVIEPVDHAIDLAAHVTRDHARIIRDFTEVPEVFGNAPRLRQVFLNLIVNAAQAIPEGSPEENEIRVRVSRESASRVAVEVSDTGTGIPPEALERIFEPFFSTKEVGQGTGLGLATSHGIVAKLGGEIRVESQVNVGTKMTVSLPVAALEREVPPGAIEKTERLTN